MSALSAAASNEDGDIISALRAENEMLSQSLLAMHNTLEMTARAGAHHARAASCLRETVIRWAARAEQAEEMLEAIGAGGVGSKVARQDHHEQHLNMVPEGWKLVPVEPTIPMLHRADGLTCIDFAALGEEGAFDLDELKEIYRAMLAAAPQPPVVEQPQGEQEPVAWQRRMRAKWMQDGEWWPWQECSQAVADDYKRAPVVNDWEYESRALYTHPQPRQPLTDDAATRLVQSVVAGSDRPIGMVEFGLLVARSTERAHGIGGEK